MYLTESDFQYFAFCLESFFLGLYSGIFVLHVQYHVSKKESNNTTQNIVFYALCVLYVLSLVVVALEVASVLAPVGINSDENHVIHVAYHLTIARTTVFGFCDFIAQSILIHRCWIVWRCNTRVVIIPSTLAFAYLVTWMAGNGAVLIGQGEINEAEWGNTMALIGLTMSMSVNALVTGLIVLRIFKVFLEIRGVTTAEEKSLGVTRGRKLRSIIFVIVESGMALFAIQLARVSIGALDLKETWTDAEAGVYDSIQGIHEILNGIAPTIILVRVSMGLSFHDEASLVEAIGSLQFAADNPNAISGAGSIGQDGSLHIGSDDPNAIAEMVDNQERRENEIGRGDDIQMVDR